MLRSRCVTTALAVGVLALRAAPASAAPLDDAKAAVEASDYLKARTALTEALASGALDREELVEVHRLSGIVAGALGEPKVATAAFQRALALAPKLALPPGTSPKIARPFAAAQAAAKQGGPLAIRSETASEPASITVIVDADPMQMIARVQAIAIVDNGPERALAQPLTRASGRASINLPAGARLDVRVAALDEHGNRLAELGSRDVPIVILGKAPVVAVRPSRAPAAARLPLAVEAAERPRERPLYLAWWLYGGAAVVFGGAATYFALDTLRAKNQLEDIYADPPNHTYDDVTSTKSRGDRSALLANIGYGVAGGLAVVGAVLFVTRPSSSSSSSSESRGLTVSPAPAPGGGTLVLGGRF